MSCDDCEVPRLYQELADETAADEAVWEEPADLTGESLTTFWWAHAAAMALLGRYFHQEYYQWIKYEPYLDYRNTDTVDYTREDKDWAWDTNEIKAWTRASSFLTLGYGLPWLFQSLNHELDNEGGTLHLIAFRMVQFTTFVMPAVLLVQFSRLYNAYDRTLAVDVQEDTDSCGNGDCLASNSFYYKPYYWDYVDFTGDNYLEVFTLDQSYQAHFMMLASAIFASSFTGYLTYGQFKADFDAARPAFKKA